MIVKDLYRLTNLAQAQRNGLTDPGFRAIRKLRPHPKWYELFFGQYSAPERLSESVTRLDAWKWTIARLACSRLTKRSRE